jgi:hypothetical protein
MPRNYQTLVEQLQRSKSDLAKALEGLNPEEIFDKVRSTVLSFATFGSDENAAKLVPLLFHALDDTFLVGPTQEAEEKHPFTETPEVREARESAKIARPLEAIRIYDNLPRQPLRKTRELLLLEIIRRWGATSDEKERASISDFFFSLEELFRGEGEIRVKALRQATDREGRTWELTNGTLMAETYVKLACKNVRSVQEPLHKDLVGALAYGVRQLLGLPPLAFRLYLPLLRLSRGPNCKGLREGITELACGLMDKAAAQQKALHELVEALTDHRERPVLHAEWIEVTYPNDPPQLGIANVRIEGYGDENMGEWLANFVDPVVSRVERWHKAHQSLTVTLTIIGQRHGSAPRTYQEKRIFQATS